MNINLAINKNPILNCFNNESFSYNILSNYKSYEGWLYNNYIGVFISKNFNNEDLALMNYLIRPFDIPGLEVSELSRDFFYSLNVDSIEFFKKKLADGYYVYVHLNEYFLYDREYFRRNDFTHDQLIVGFDDTGRSFKILGYNNRGKQEVSEVNYDSFKYSLKYLKPYNRDQEKIFFFKVNECPYKFDLKYLIHQLENYLKSINLSERDLSYTLPDIFYDSDKIAFGIETYSIIKKYYESMHNNVDLRLSHKLLEHKKWISEILKFLSTEYKISSINSFKKQMDEIVSLSVMVKKYSLKYNIVSKYSLREPIIDKILDLLMEIQHKEYRLLNQLIAELKKLRGV